MVAQERRPTAPSPAAPACVVQRIDQRLGLCRAQGQPQPGVEPEREHHVRPVVRAVAVRPVYCGAGRRRRWPRTAARRHPRCHCTSCRQSSRIAKSFGPGSHARLDLLEDERRGVDPEAGDAQLQPEPHDPLDLVADRRVAPVQVGLEVVEAVVVPGAGLLVAATRSPSARRGTPCPAVRSGGSSSLHTYQSRYGESRIALRADRNQGCSSEVWLTTRSSSTRMPRCRRLQRELGEVAERAEPRVDAVVVGDVVAVVPVRRRDGSG